MNNLIDVCYNSNRILIISDCVSECATEILLKLIQNNKKIFNCIETHYDRKEIDNYIRYNSDFIILRPYVTDIRDLNHDSPCGLIPSNFIYNSMIFLLIRNNNLTIHKNSSGFLLEYKNYDVSNFNRSLKIKQIKERINKKKLWKN